MAILGASSIPSQRINKGMSDSGGVKRNDSIKNEEKRRDLSLTANQTPRPMPTREANTKPENVRMALIAICVNSAPVSIISAKATNTISGVGNKIVGIPAYSPARYQAMRIPNGKTRLRARFIYQKNYSKKDDGNITQMRMTLNSKIVTETARYYFGNFMPNYCQQWGKNLSKKTFFHDDAPCQVTSQNRLKYLSITS